MSTLDRESEAALCPVPSGPVLSADIVDLCEKSQRKNPSSFLSSSPTGDTISPFASLYSVSLSRASPLDKQSSRDVS